jgi:hypothetical protein
MGVSASSIERPDLGWGSFERECVLHAFLMNPRRTWTSASLSSWYGIRLDLVRAILSELAEERIICRSRGQTGTGWSVKTSALRAGPVRQAIRPTSTRSITSPFCSNLAPWSRKRREPSPKSCQLR